MFTLRNKIESGWNEEVTGTFMDAYLRAHSLVSGRGEKFEDNCDCVVIWMDDKRVAEVHHSRAWTWVHADYRDEWNWGCNQADGALHD